VLPVPMSKFYRLHEEAASLTVRHSACMPCTSVDPGVIRSVHDLLVVCRPEELDGSESTGGCDVMTAVSVSTVVH
jgi:hypothetical protein